MLSVLQQICDDIIIFQYYFAFFSTCDDINLFIYFIMQNSVENKFILFKHVSGIESAPLYEWIKLVGSERKKK